MARKVLHKNFGRNIFFVRLFEQFFKEVDPFQDNILRIA